MAGGKLPTAQEQWTRQRAEIERLTAELEQSRQREDTLRRAIEAALVELGSLLPETLIDAERLERATAGLTRARRGEP